MIAVAAGRGVESHRSMPMVEACCPDGLAEVEVEEKRVHRRIPWVSSVGPAAKMERRGEPSTDAVGCRDTQRTWLVKSSCDGL
jgi:hypothetical protein